MTRIHLLFPAVTMVVIVIISLGWFRSCDREKTLQDELFKERNGARKVEVRENARISAINDSLATIKRERDNYKAEYLKASKALKTVESRRTKKYTQAKAAIKPVSDSIPSVKAFEMASDSLLAVKDSIIMAEQRNNLVQYKSFSDEINKLHGVIDSQGKISDAWRVAAEQAERKAGKQEKRKKFFRTTTLILAGALGIVIATQ